MKLLKPGWVAQDDHPIFSIDIHPAGGKFATGGQGDDCGRVTVWNLAPILNPKLQKDSNVPKMLCQMDNHLACVNSVRWSGSGKFLASAGDDQRVILWTKSAYGGGAVFGSGKVNHESYRVAHTLRIHDGDVLDIAWSPGDVWLATASVDNTVVVWDVEKLPSTVAILKGHTGHVKGVTWDPVGKYLATQSADKTLRVWRTSDWGEEAKVSEPFEECGGTTHVLRLDWSPDGAYIVSAHAMNGGGPTAQILERDGWRFEKDFVGHRKAVTCVRFNDNMFEKEQKLDGKKKNTQYLCIAIGSRDRSLSVWLTSLKRPLFVIHDVFESSILDLAWSKDGMVLLACSMDGSVAAVVLNEEELGTPMSKESKSAMLKKVYGQTIGQFASAKPTLIENPELLRLQHNGGADSEADTEAGEERGTNKASSASVVKGPLDKQIEMKTSDGRRRITPIFILPNSEAANSMMANPVANGTNGNSTSSESLAKYHMQSSSSGAKSKIRIEKVDGVVEPNVSPGKKKEGKSTTIISTSSTTSTPALPPAPKANMIAIKHKPGPVNSSNPAIKTASVPSKPTSASSSDQQGSNTNTDSSDSQSAKVKVKKPGDKEKEEKTKKKKANRIESSTDSSDSSESDSSSSSSDDETASQTSKSGTEKEEKKSEQPTKKPGIITSVPAKTGLVTNKRKAEDAPAVVQPPQKKRGRPPGSGSLTPVSSRTAPAPPAPVPAPQPPPPATLAVPLPTPSSPSRPCPGLPPLTLVNNRQKLHFSQLTVDGVLLNIFVHNDLTNTAYGALHKVTANKTTDPNSSVVWDLMLPSPVTSVLSTQHHLLLTCKDATCHLLDRSGSRAIPAFSLPAPPHRIQVFGARLAAVTTNAKLFVWKLDPLPMVVIKNEDIGPLQRVNKKQSISLTKMSFSKEDQPILCLSDGSVHSYSPGLGCWLLLQPTRTAATNVKLNQPAAFAGTQPLAKLASTSSGVVIKVDEATEDTNVASAIESRVASSLHLGSPTEYRYWLVALVKRLAKAGQETRLRALLDSLLGPPSKAATWVPEVLGIKKRTLLVELLPHVASNMALQRLYSEYNTQMQGTTATDLFSK